ncbi:MAG: hypothetical protein LBC08_05255, partial [Campylobacteraceae bacterium]|nr:hypothetical protein [Campylobacteraceae bacterium]
MKLGFKIAVAAAICTNVNAFVPRYMFVPGEYHEKMVAEVLDKIYEEYRHGAYTSAMKTAVRAIAKANSQVDADDRSGKAIWHCDGEQLTQCSNNVKDETIKGIGEMLLGKIDDARYTIGGATHTLQDFYAHSNWVELYGAVASDEMGYGPISNVAEPYEDTCEYVHIHPLTSSAKACALMNKNNIITTKLTSGYYKGTSEIPEGVKKCFHGGFLDGYGLEGINKDASVCSFGAFGIGLVISPHNTFHAEAAIAAKIATVNYFHNIKDTLIAKEGEVNGDSAFRKFLGLGGATVGFIISASANMAEEIDGVKTAVAQVVQSKIGTDEEPPLYVISTANNPSIPEHSVLTRSNAFFNVLSNLHAKKDSGVECPELSGLNIYKTVLSLTSGSTLFVYTDASMKDIDDAKAASILANRNHININSVLSGQCSFDDSSYSEISGATGGQTFIINKSEAGQLARLSDILTSNHHVQIANIDGEDTNSYEFKVDSKTDKLSVSVSITDGNAAVLLIRPDGSIVKADELDSEQTVLSSAAVYDIRNPDIGTWKIDVKGSSKFTISAAGNSSLSFDDFKFIEPRHESFFETDGFPVAGTTSAVEAALYGTVSDVRLELVSNNGSLIESLTINATAKRSKTETIFFKDDFLVPNEDFTVYAVGKDENGAEFQRVLSHKITPQTVSVTAPSNTNIPLNTDTVYTFRVTNHAELETFNFSATDG